MLLIFRPSAAASVSKVTPRRESTEANAAEKLDSTAPICPNACSGWGICVDSECQCFDYRIGSDCSVTFASQACGIFWGTDAVVVFAYAVSLVISLILMVIIGCKNTVRHYTIWLVFASTVCGLLGFSVDPMSVAGIYPPFVQYFFPFLSDTFLMGGMTALFLFWIELTQSNNPNARRLQKTWPFLTSAVLALFVVAIVSSALNTLMIFLVVFFPLLFLFGFAFLAAGLYLRNMLKDSADTTAITRVAVTGCVIMVLGSVVYAVSYALWRTHTSTVQTFLITNAFARLIIISLGIFVSWSISPLMVQQKASSGP